jgi:hypothetical protein
MTYITDCKEHEKDTMSPNVPLREYCPSLRIGMFRRFVPCRLGKFATRAVDQFHRCPVTDTIVVRRYANNRTISLMKTDIILLEMTASHSVEVPESREAGEKWARDRKETSCGESIIDEVEDVV